MKFLIAGLGNIGDEYARTRHNIGFDIADSLAAEKEVAFTPQRLAFHAEIKYRGKTLILIKPTTYMNLSGKAVNYWMQEENIPLERTLIVTDDLALPFGILRLRKKGSDGGHNGLKNIIETLSTTTFARLRFGIGNEFPHGLQVNYVLSSWSTEEKKKLPDRIKTACEMIKSFTAIGLDRTMSSFNNK